MDTFLFLVIYMKLILREMCCNRAFVKVTLSVQTVAHFADFVQIRESLCREKFWNRRSAKVYVRKIFQQIGPTAKVNVCEK